MVFAVVVVALATATFLLPVPDARETPFVRVSALMFGALGLLATRREEGRTIGWLMLVIGSAHAVFDLSAAYAETLRPGAAWAYLAGEVFSLVDPVVQLILLPLLFPTGRVASPRLRWVVPTALVLLGLAVLDTLLLADVYETQTGVVIGPNPLGVEAATAALELAFLPIVLAALGLAVTAFVAFVKRFRRSTGIERLQLRWLVFGLAVAFVFIASLILLGMASNLTDGYLDLPESVVDVLGGMVFLVLPASIGVAVLRYRLYAIDRVISRTVAYALVTALLLALYLSMVVGAQTLLGGRVGDSDLVVAISTLTVAALFRPLRRRVQRVVDRRFNRARYDTANTLEAFAGRLRGAVDLAALTNDLDEVVRATFQPRSASVWVPTGETRP